MKIGILLRVLWPSAVPKTAIKQTEGLIGRGHLANLIVWRESNYKYKFEHQLYRVPFTVILRGKIARLSELLNYAIFYPLMPFYRSKESAIDVQLFIALPLMLRSKYDLLVAHDQIASIVAFLTKKLFNVPYIAFLYEPLEVVSLNRAHTFIKILNKVIDTFVKAILKDADAVVASSIPMYKWLRSRRVNSRILWIQEGCDVHHHIKPVEERDCAVLTVSRWDRGRNPFFFLDIAEKVPYAKFIIAGSWTPKLFKDEFISEMKRRSLDSRVLVMSDIPDGVLRELYMKAKVVVRWGFEKGVPTGILEGMSFGCPIVTNEGFGGSSIIKHGIHGYIAKRIDATEFAHYIDLILKDNELWKKMSLNCRRLSFSYSWDKHVDKLNTLILEILKGGK